MGLNICRRIWAFIFLISLFVSCNDTTISKSEKERASVTFPDFLTVGPDISKQFNSLSSDTARLGFLLKFAKKDPVNYFKIMHYVADMPHDSIALGHGLTALIELEMDLVRREIRDSVMIYLRKGVELSKPYLRYRDRLALFYRELGRYYSHHSDFANGINYYNKAVSLSEKYSSPEDHIMYVSELGSVYQLMEEDDKAQVYFLKAKAYGEKTGDAARLTYALNALGDLARARGKMDSAISLHRQAFLLYKKLGKNDFWAITSLGKIYTNINELDKAEEYFNYVISEGARDKDLVSQCYYNLSRCDQKRGQIQGAIKKATKAYEVSLTSPDILIRRIIAEKLVELYKENKQFEKALEYNFIYNILADSIENKGQIKKMAEAEFKNREEKLIAQNDLKLKAEEEKREMNEKRHTVTVIFISIVLVMALVFSLFIYRSLQKNKKQTLVINEQKKLVEEKQQEILDSIHYARRIQKALLASDKLLSTNLNEHFVLYKPRDIVSGDFYWAHRINDKFLLCTADCTGHGVPGAFMSLLNISFLNEALLEKKQTQPDKILNNIRESIILTLNSEGNDESKDGMDCILCTFDLKNKKLEYAAANNSFYIIRNGKLLTQTADKMPVGKSPGDHVPFKSRTIDLQSGDVIYTLTDGYADQFGGPKGKKFKSHELEELLLANHHLPMIDQSKILNSKFESWKGSLEQVDDILIIGIRI